MKNNRCDLCALRVIFDQEKVSEDFFADLNRLMDKKIIENVYNRHISLNIGKEGAEGKSEMCAVNSRYFWKKEEKCPDFILNTGMAVTDALSINLSRKNIELAIGIKRLTWFIAFLTVAILFLTIISMLQ